MTYDDLCAKEVISVKDCRKLGHVVDLEIDECNGCIRKLMVSSKSCIWNFFSCNEEAVIPYSNIRKIGPDIILVDFCC